VKTPTKPKTLMQNKKLKHNKSSKIKCNV